MARQPVRWGILATGTIAHKFAEGLSAVPEATLAAVGSRSRERADAFAAWYGAARAHGSYAALAQDPEVDVVYVATPHSLHRDNTLRCLEAGKAVLCEKPLALNAREAREMADVARANGQFLMEAMWSRFLPSFAQLRQWLHGGAIGEPRMVLADFGFRSDIETESRLFNPEFGGGGLLDVGVYAVSFASMVFGEAPEAVAGRADVGETGVDEQAAAVLAYSGGRLASVACAIRTTTPQEAWVLGTEGRIHLPGPFWCGTEAVLHRDGKTPETAHCPFEGNGYNWEAAAVGECLRAGRREHALMPLEESIAIMETMDGLREQWGVRYAADSGK